jgi:hypothetical protein
MPLNHEFGGGLCDGRPFSLSMDSHCAVAIDRLVLDHRFGQARGDTLNKPAWDVRQDERR